MPYQENDSERTRILPLEDSLELVIPEASPVCRTCWMPINAFSVLIGMALMLLGVAIGISTTGSSPVSDSFDPPASIELEGHYHHYYEKIDRDCSDGGYSVRTLQLAYELPFAALFPDTKNQTKFEASSVVLVNRSAYAVCDSSWAISKIDQRLQPFYPGNRQIGNPQREKTNSGYEALMYNDGHFYVVRESIQHNDTKFRAIIERLAVSADESDYRVEEMCSTEYTFEGDSKGLEGAVAVHGENDELVILGLCEGNHCSERHKDHRGQGRIIIMRRTVLDDGKCQWSTVRKINVPPTAAFLDYSAIAMDKNGRVAISSQEDSQLWVGQLTGKQGDGTWDVDTMELDPNVGTVYDLPKNEQCETIYCNIEGVHWVNENMIIAVSDQMKKKGRQHFRCFDKDQSVHIFVLPP